MTGAGQRGRTPFDVALCALLIGGCGFVFLAASVLRLLAEGDVGVLTLPVVVAVLEAGAAGSVFAGIRLARPAVFVLLMLVTVLHLLIAMGGGAMWTRVVSAVLAAGGVYALVLLNTRPIREYFGSSR